MHLRSALDAWPCTPVQCLIPRTGIETCCMLFKNPSICFVVCFSCERARHHTTGRHRRLPVGKTLGSRCMCAAAEAALAPDEEATEVQEGAAAPDHDDGEPLVDEAAEEEEHEDAPMIPKE